MLTQEKLKELFLYVPENGAFIRLKSVSRKARVGAVAGTFSKALGYITIKIDMKHYQAHRLAWLYMTGEFPTHFIDHIDCVRDNNAWYNLRQATKAQNEANRGATKRNKTGCKGVWYDASRDNFQARLGKNGKTIHLGRYATAEEAHGAYKLAIAEHHGEFARPA